MSIRRFKSSPLVKVFAFIASLLAVGVAADQNYVGVGGSAFSGGTVAGATTFGSTVTASGEFIGRVAADNVTPAFGFTGATNYGYGYNTSNLDTYFVANGTGWVEMGTAAGSKGFNIAGNTNGYNATNAINNAPDVGLQRVATGIYKISNGGAGAGSLQLACGELALNADYTNGTAAFTATNLVTPTGCTTSGRTYNFTFHATFQDSTAADGAQFDFNAGAATVTNFRAHCHSFNNVGAALTLTNGGSTTLATAIQVSLAATTQTEIECNGSFVPSSTATFGVRAAQTAHTTGTLTINRGAWLSYRDANPL